MTKGAIRLAEKQGHPLVKHKGTHRKGVLTDDLIVNTEKS